MTKQNNNKITFLFIAIVMFTMVPVYYFTMSDASGWQKWLPTALFAALGVGFLIGYFRK